MPKATFEIDILSKAEVLNLFTMTLLRGQKLSLNLIPITYKNSDKNHDFASCAMKVSHFRSSRYTGSMAKPQPLVSSVVKPRPWPQKWALSFSNPQARSAFATMEQVQQKRGTAVIQAAEDAAH
jgi:hypothetical protein